MFSLTVNMLKQTLCCLAHPCPFHHPFPSFSDVAEARRYSVPGVFSQNIHWCFLAFPCVPVSMPIPRSLSSAEALTFLCSACLSCGTQTFPSFLHILTRIMSGWKLLYSSCYVLSLLPDSTRSQKFWWVCCKVMREPVLFNHVVFRYPYRDSDLLCFLEFWSIRGCLVLSLVALYMFCTSCVMDWIPDWLNLQVSYYIWPVVEI